MDSTLSSFSTESKENIGSTNTFIVNDTTTTSATASSKLIQDIIDICSSNLSDSALTRDASSFCLSSLLTRPDMEAEYLGRFIYWACDVMSNWISRGDEVKVELSNDSFRVVGVLLCLSQIFKKGHRQRLLPFAGVVLGPCIQLGNLPLQTLTRKLVTKLYQRIGVTFLPTVVPKWRYERGQRSLLHNLQSSIAAALPRPPTSSLGKCSMSQNVKQSDHDHNL